MEGLALQVEGFFDPVESLVGPFAVSGGFLFDAFGSQRGASFDEVEQSTDEQADAEDDGGQAGDEEQASVGVGWCGEGEDDRDDDGGGPAAAGAGYDCGGVGVSGGSCHGAALRYVDIRTVMASAHLSRIGDVGYMTLT